MQVEKVEKEEEEAATRGLTYTDTDGTVMEWDPVRKAYFPQVSAGKLLTSYPHSPHPFFPP